MTKIRVGILGATGFVGQHYVSLLTAHPDFEITYIAASQRNVGKSLQDAIGQTSGRELLFPLNSNLEKMSLHNVTDIATARRNCDIVFSACDLETKHETAQLEIAYACCGLPVFSNSSANRFTKNVPLLIPEINADHLDYVHAFGREHNTKGFVVAKPNCSIQSYMMPIHALREQGFEPKKIFVSTYQSVSGAGTFDVNKVGANNNVVPFIKGEDEKSEQEPMKIFLQVSTHHDRKPQFSIFARCVRVPVLTGHLASVHIEYSGNAPALERARVMWDQFTGLPQELNLYSAPKSPIEYVSAIDGPQPLRDMVDGMVVYVGGAKLQAPNVLSFVGLSNNLIRGAAGGSILNAELAHEMGYF